VREHIGHIRQAHEVELIVINAENAAGGFGLTPQLAEELFDLGADVLTPEPRLGQARADRLYERCACRQPGTRPPRAAPGKSPAGSSRLWLYEGTTQSGVDLRGHRPAGCVFMNTTNDPFHAINALLAGIQAKVVVVDFHAEATSEKVAMGWHLDGRVTAVLGTHTHVPPRRAGAAGGTAYQTDVA